VLAQSVLLSGVNDRGFTPPPIVMAGVLCLCYALDTPPLTAHPVAAQLCLASSLQW
jgi:hypothetical protein